MKILFILDEFLPENTGGAANIAFALAKEIIKSGHNLLVLTATSIPESIGEIEVDGLKIKRIYTHPFGKFRNFKNLKNPQILSETTKVLEKYRADIVHIHSLHHRFSYGVIGLAKQFSKTIFVTLHDSQTIYNGKLFPKRKICNLNPEFDYKVSCFDNLKKDGFGHNPFQKYFIKRALKKVDKIFAVSNALKSAVEANGISNVEVMYNGINVDEWASDGMANKNILFAGRVDEAKGVRVLVNAFNLVNLEIPDAKLTIIGDGDFRAEGNNNIKILPWQSREDMKKVFLQAAIVVVPSLYLDPFPTVNLEAMASGRPVIGTCFGGTPEVVVNNETGRIVNPYNEKDLADKIIDLLKNPEKAIVFGKAGRERIEKLFSLNKQVQATLNWYQKFL